MLSDPADLSILREAIRSAKRLFSAPVFQSSVFDTILPPSNATTDEDLNAYIRTAAAPYLHASSSAAMSAHGANWGVVDPDYRVKGATGLRVVDASVIVS